VPLYAENGLIDIHPDIAPVALRNLERSHLVNQASLLTHLAWSVKAWLAFREMLAR